MKGDAPDALLLFGDLDTPLVGADEDGGTERVAGVGAGGIVELLVLDVGPVAAAAAAALSSCRCRKN